VKSLFDSPHEGDVSSKCFMAKGPKVIHPEYFNSDEDDLIDEEKDGLLSYDVLAKGCKKQEG
jgi:hypothetical protein